MLAISLTIACSRYIYNGVILHEHPVRGESHKQSNTALVSLYGYDITQAYAKCLPTCLCTLRPVG